MWKISREIVYDKISMGNLRDFITLDTIDEL